MSIHAVHSVRCQHLYGGDKYGWSCCGEVQSRRKFGSRRSQSALVNLKRNHSRKSRFLLYSSLPIIQLRITKARGLVPPTSTKYVVNVCLGGLLCLTFVQYDGGV